MSETKYCPHCGIAIDNESVFCGNCGGNVNEKASPLPIQPTPQPNYPQQQPTQRMYSAPLAPKPQSLPPNALGIIGFILNIATFVGLSWGCFVVSIYVAIVFFVIAITGIIMSSIAMKRSRVISLIGLILGILGTIPILVPMFILLIALLVLIFL